MVLVLIFLILFDVFGKYFLFFFDVFQNKIEEKMYVLANFYSAAGATHRKNSQERTFFLQFCFEKVEKEQKIFQKVKKEQEKKHKNHQNLCSRSTKKKKIARTLNSQTTRMLQTQKTKAVTVS